MVLPAHAIWDPATKLYRLENELGKQKDETVMSKPKKNFQKKNNVT